MRKYDKRNKIYFGIVLVASLILIIIFSFFIAKVIKNGKIELGTVHNKELLYMDTPEIITLVENLLSYALVRDEYREICKRKREFDK